MLLLGSSTSAAGSKHLLLQPLLLLQMGPLQQKKNSPSWGGPHGKTLTPVRFLGQQKGAPWGPQTGGPHGYWRGPP